MADIPQKELRNNSGEILRRAEAGERFTITVSGRPVAELGPAERHQWVNTSTLGALFLMPEEDPNLAADLAAFDAELRDPWA